MFAPKVPALPLPRFLFVFAAIGFLLIGAAPLLAQEGGGDAPASPLLSPFVLPAGLLFLFYFIVIAPERRRKREEANLLAAIAKNDRVVTVGGIHGTVVSVGDDEIITLKIAENTRVKLNRSAVSRIVSEKKVDAEPTTKAESDSA